MKKPKQEGYLRVSKLHKIHYRLYGDINKPLIVYLHGGPGGEGVEEWINYIDLRKYSCLFYDQRGCGRSEPWLELKENTTEHLVDDLNKLQQHLKINKIIILADSWGTTLALNYALKYSENIDSMILNGLFLGRDKDYKWLYHDAPKKYIKEYIKIFNKKYNFKSSTDFLNYSYKQIKEKNIDWIISFAQWEFFLLMGKKNHSFYNFQKIDEEEISLHWSISTIETFYFKNKCFLKKPLLSKDNIKIFNTIPIVLNHGHFDEVCLLDNSVQFNKNVKSSILNQMNMRHASYNDTTNNLIIKRSLKQIKKIKKDLE